MSNPRRDALERVLTYAASDRLTDLDDGDSDRAGSYVTSLEAERNNLKAEVELLRSQSGRWRAKTHGLKPGWYHYWNEHPDEGSCGPFSTDAKCLQAALDTDENIVADDVTVFEVKETPEQRVAVLEAERDALKAECQAHNGTIELMHKALATADAEVGRLRSRLASAERVVEAARAWAAEISESVDDYADCPERALLAAVREHEEGTT